ncbi:MAG: hypothetical protein INF97_03660 [Roseomonas sp.]|nr:hypothetical protein [Roseomonas sp.]
MALRAGGGYLRLRRALGVPAPVQGLRARGARLSGARLAAPISGTVLQFARDGALRLQIGASAGFVLVAEAGVFTLAGQDVDLRLGSAGFVLVAEAGVFSLAGQDVALLLARRLLAEAGVFSLAGQDVTFVLQTSDVAAFARALHRHAAVARQATDKAVAAAQLQAPALLARLSTKGVGRP